MNDEQNDAVKDAVLAAIEEAMAAQLKAVRRLRRREKHSESLADAPKTARMSQTKMAEAILIDDGPLHVQELIAKIRERFGIDVDRESIVSALSKKIVRDERFQRVGKNTFDVRG